MKRRIFIAVDISDEVRKKVAEYIGELKDQFPMLKIGWDRPEKLHLTLKFLGDTDENQLEKLITICEKFCSEISNLKFQMAATGVFPSPRKARVLWLGVNGDVEELQNINSILENECEKIGLKKENRMYKPHLTIARLREPQNAKQIVQIHLANKFEPVGFEVPEIVIYESKLQPTGSIYKKVSSFKFQVKNDV